MDIDGIKERVAKRFKNQKELDNYMRKHPGAKKFYHRVMPPIEREMQKKVQREHDQREREMDRGGVDERQNRGKGGPGSMRWRLEPALREIQEQKGSWLAKVEALMNRLKEFEGEDKERAGALLKRLEAIRDRMAGRQASVSYAASRLLMASVATRGVFRRFAQLSDDQKQEVVKKVMEKLQKNDGGKDEEGGKEPSGLDDIEKQVDELEQGAAADSVTDEKEGPPEPAGFGDGEEDSKETDGEAPAADEEQGEESSGDEETDGEVPVADEEQEGESSGDEEDAESPDAAMIDEALGKDTGGDESEEAPEDAGEDGEEPPDEGEAESPSEGEEGGEPGADAEDEGAEEIPEEVPEDVPDDGEVPEDKFKDVPADETEDVPPDNADAGGNNENMLKVVNDLAAELKQVKSDGRVDPSEVLGLLGNMMQMVTLLVEAKPPRRRRSSSIDEVARIEKLIDRVARHGLGSRGMQVRRKDKDLMSDTGGVSKVREREPEAKPPRDDMKKPHRTKDTPARVRDPDTHNDPDNRKD
jgi:hypothetical protein